ncbi:structural maintenance of chromosomes protein 6B-like [Senna tora]|uniref:Structural maintenance of chromosomes protein 6B-like n=1 Tax=Senna tora TaxID=362788 RepID=A0A834SG95_9FABA|nr:structural maintenance of chromosomes protein 6B-like [Senna tora]
MEVGMFEEPSSGVLFMKGLIWYDLKKSIRSGVNLGNAKDGIYWVDFRYEKIPRHCYMCGIFGHDEEDCEEGKRTDASYEINDVNKLGPWLKARSVGKRIAWPGSNKNKENRSNIEEGNKVGMVKRVDADELMDKLARMTVREVGGASKEGRGGDVVRDETNRAIARPMMTIEKEKEISIKIKGGDGETNNEIKEKEKVMTGKDGGREEMVFREIQNLKEGNTLLTSEGMKENINPSMKSSGGKQWKILARNNGVIQPQSPIEQKMGKRKNTTEGTREDEEKEPTSSKKMKSVAEGDGDSISISAARCGYRPSTTWRSLMEGRAVLSKGLRREIGNGRTTSVWTDPWIPADVPTIASRPNHTEMGEETVSVLLNEDATEWDAEELRARFDEDTCIRIQSIPPNPCQGEDRWIWEHDRKGVYSVKTGYKSTMLEVWSQFDIGLDIDKGAAMRLWKMPIISRIGFLELVCFFVLSLRVLFSLIVLRCLFRDDFVYLSFPSVDGIQSNVFHGDDPAGFFIHGPHSGHFLYIVIDHRVGAPNERCDYVISFQSVPLGGEPVRYEAFPDCPYEFVSPYHPRDLEGFRILMWNARDISV